MIISINEEIFNDFEDTINKILKEFDKMKDESLPEDKDLDEFLEFRELYEEQIEKKLINEYINLVRKLIKEVINQVVENKRKKEIYKYVINKNGTKLNPLGIEVPQKIEERMWEIFSRIDERINGFRSFYFSHGFVGNYNGKINIVEKDNGKNLVEIFLRVKDVKELFTPPIYMMKINFYKVKDIKDEILRNKIKILDIPVDILKDVKSLILKEDRKLDDEDVLIVYHEIVKDFVKDEIINEDKLEKLKENKDGWFFFLKKHSFLQN